MPDLDPGRRRRPAFPQLGRALDGSAVIYNKHSFSDTSIVEMHTTLSVHPFQVALPPGRYTLVVERGKEYHAATRQLEIGRRAAANHDPAEALDRYGPAGWYSGDTHVHRPAEEVAHLMLAEDLNVAIPLTDWVRDAFVAPAARRGELGRDPGPELMKIDENHCIFPVNTEYELFTVGGKPHTQGAVFVINHKTPRTWPRRRFGRCRAGPPRWRPARARQAQLALVDDDRPDLARRPVRAVQQPHLGDRVRLQQFRLGRRRLHGDRKRREASPSGAGSIWVSELLRAAQLRISDAAHGRLRVGRPSRSTRLRPRLRPSGDRPAFDGPAWIRA